MTYNFPTCHTKQTQLNPLLKVIFQGILDEESPLSLLRGIPYILQVIWSDVTSYWKNHIKEGDTHNLSYAEIEFNKDEDPYWGVMLLPRKLCHFPERLQFTFPESTNLNINMMPFIMSRDFARSRLPKNLKKYFNSLIIKCIPGDEIGRIGYLTIHEGIVKEKSSQRRPGIHTEAPGVVLINGCEGKNMFVRYWGGGGLEMNVCRGGIYMASSVEDSCAVWNCQILRPENGTDVVGKDGDMEYLREFLPKCEMMKKNTVYWITDRTPHESLPLKKQAYRQFFRLVTSEVSLWYADHSTKNPCGVVPDKKITKIVKGSKFDKKGVVLCE